MGVIKLGTVMGTQEILQKAIDEVQQAHATLREAKGQVEITNELSMLGDVQDALQGAVNFLSNRDDER